jgi:polygalacturonase
MAHRLTRRRILGVSLTAAGAAAATPFLTRAALAGTADAPSAAVRASLTKAIPTLPWAAANDIVAATKLPAFPSVNFDVTKYGAKGDGQTDNTSAFAEAITAANAAGGGHVVVPSGTFVTGAIYLKSNVDLHLSAGSVIKFSGNASKYPIVLTRYESIECMNRSPMIYAYGEHNIAVTGSGTLDAGGTASWNTGSDRAYLESLISNGITDPRKRIVPGSGHHLRSTFIEPYNCDTVLIQGVTLHNSQFWQIHPTLCKNVTVDGVTTAATVKNTDGCDPECSDHVLIVNSTLGGNDDNIAIKSGRDADGRRVNVPSQNIVVANNTMKGPWGAVTCGSEQTGGICNVYAYKCVVTGTRYTLFIKSNTRRGGFTQNINLDSIVGHGNQLAFAFAQLNYMGQTGPYLPQFGNWNITNCTADHTPYAFKMTGLSKDHIKGLTVKDCTFTNIGNPDLLSNVDNVSFTNVTLNGKPDKH